MGEEYAAGSEILLELPEIEKDGPLNMKVRTSGTLFLFCLGDSCQKQKYCG